MGSPKENQQKLHPASLETTLAVYHEMRLLGDERSKGLEEMLLQREGSRLWKLWGEAALQRGPETLCCSWSPCAVAPCLCVGVGVGWYEALMCSQPGFP